MKKVKIGLIGAFDMLKFKNMAKDREKVIQSFEPKEIKADYTINQKAKAYHPEVMALKIVEIIDYPKANAKSYVFTAADGSQLPFFRAGQYLSFVMELDGSQITRAYSIHSSPQWVKEGKIGITVQANADGFAADRILNNWKIGDVLFSSGPQGNFYYEPLRDAGKVIGVAGGSGITPFLSMAYAIRDGIEDFELTILYGSRRKDSIFFYNELEKITKATEKVKVIHVLSDEQIEGFRSGFITADLIREAAGTAKEYSVFLCGPEAMYKFVLPEIDKLGLARKYIRTEIHHISDRLTGDAAESTGNTSKTYLLTVHQGPDTYEIKANAAEPILVAIERAGINAPSRCRGGECGWCRAKVLKGSYDAPEEFENRRAADIKHNYIHPCACFATSDLEIDLPFGFDQ